MANRLSRGLLANRLSRGLLAAASLGVTVSLTAGAGQALAQPDLVPQLNNPMNASVGVQNTGTSAAGPSHLTINCTEFGELDGGCPDAPGMAAYVDPAFPNRVVIDVPALAPNESFNHDLTFWNAIPWTPGTYVFDAEADAGNAVAESNEANNTTQSSHTQQFGIGVAPPPPLPLTATPAPARPAEPARRDSRKIFQLKQPRDAAPAEPGKPKRLRLRAPAS